MLSKLLAALQVPTWLLVLLAVAVLAVVASQLLRRISHRSLEWQLFEAARRGDTRTAHGLLGAGAISSWANPDMQDMTALHVAACNGHVAVLNVLLSPAGPRLDKRDALGRTPLDCAFDRGHGTCAQLLNDKLMSVAAELREILRQQGTKMNLPPDRLQNYIDVTECRFIESCLPRALLDRLDELPSNPAMRRLQQHQRSRRRRGRNTR